MDAPPQLPSTTSSGISASGTLSDAAASLLHLFLFLFSTSFSQSYHIPRGAPSSVLHSARHHPSPGISSHSHGEVMPGLFHDASGKVAHEVRDVYIHAYGSREGHRFALGVRLIVWSLALGVWSLALGVWSLALGVWSLALGVWSLALGVWSLEFGAWSLALGVCHAMGEGWWAGYPWAVYYTRACNLQVRVNVLRP